MTVKELSELAHAPIEVRSGYNGKLLCKRYSSKKHQDVSDREVTAIWTEIRTNCSGGYSSFATPVICVYVCGDKEYEQEAANEATSI